MNNGEKKKSLIGKRSNQKGGFPLREGMSGGSMTSTTVKGVMEGAADREVPIGGGQELFDRKRVTSGTRRLNRNGGQGGEKSPLSKSGPKRGGIEDHTTQLEKRRGPGKV